MKECVWSDRDVLARSLFYYCCGRDATPVVAFGAHYPLYVYVDRAEGWIAGLETALERKGLCKLRDVPLACDMPFAAHATLSEWTDGTARFLLLCVQGDAIRVYRALYGDALPRCICNYRYEMPFRGVIEQAEHRVECVLGHCFDPAYRAVGSCDYLGDYGAKNARVTLYRRTDCEE